GSRPDRSLRPLLFPEVSQGFVRGLGRPIATGGGPTGPRGVRARGPAVFAARIPLLPDQGFRRHLHLQPHARRADRERPVTATSLPNAASPATIDLAAFDRRFARRGCS